MKSIENTKSYQTDYSVYPGEYIPLLRKEDVLRELGRPHAGDSIRPPVNITEFPHSFKVEIAIPGVAREEFLIRADEKVLSVCVLKKRAITRERSSFQFHEFNYECVECNIILPENAEAQFVSAEYKAGILLLYVPKMIQPVKNTHVKIAVY